MKKPHSPRKLSLSEGPHVRTPALGNEFICSKNLPSSFSSVTKGKKDLLSPLLWLVISLFQHGYLSTAKGLKKAAIAYNMLFPSSARVLTGACPGSSDVESSTGDNMRKE